MSTLLHQSLTIPKVGRKHRVAGIAGAGEALLVAEYIQNSQQSVLFIARDSLAAAHLFEEIAFFAPTITVNVLPDWGVLPYDLFSPTAENNGNRIKALALLLEARPALTITTAAAMLLPCAPPSFIAARAFQLQVGGQINLQALIKRLQQGGYARVDRVLTAGEFALYGGQIDIFPPGATHPFRLLLMDEEIEQIRLFDSETQRSTEQVNNIDLLPMSECDLSVDGISCFRANFLETVGDAKATIYQQISRAESAPGMEFFLPLFFAQTGRLFDYLPTDCLMLTQHNMHESLSAFLQQARLRQQIVSAYENRPTLPVAQLFLSETDFFSRLSDYAVVEIEAPTERTAPPPVAINPRVASSYQALIDFLTHFVGHVIIVVDSPGRRDALASVLTEAGIRATDKDNLTDCLQATCSLIIASMRSGFILPEAQLAVLTEAEIFQISLLPRCRRQSKGVADILHLTEIQAGDYVVHHQYGIGRVCGLKNLTIHDKVGEFLEIEYAEEQRLWLPIGQLHWLQRHHGEVDLSKMGGSGWRRVHKRALQRAQDTAVRLLEINARRCAAANSTKGWVVDETLLAKFRSHFTHVETADQESATIAVLEDLQAGKPMDRLIVADVGFGKTEIAMRAAAAVVFAGGQVAILAPTTLLSEQHYRSFSDRFAGFPVRIAALTRMNSTIERRQILAELASGKIDIIIGTHALLQKSVRYSHLGLVVIDEEHRFGVQHKEKFKTIRADVDILSLSATPIPRSLSMALEGLRHLSIINTPPPSRLAIKTMVTDFSQAIVVEACERELLRGGQIFFIHNEIASIDQTATLLAEWLPRARIVVAHGAMASTTLGNTMRRFLRREADILLCTTIVESGLDIANANTIIVNRADRMGISRLHQLRGRVGRGVAQAYAYFLLPPDITSSKRSQARLAALQDYSALGSGFFLSMRDLEIRGAGEILGERQSGDIEAVGCAMYQSMVNAAAKRLQGEEDIDSDVTTTISLSAPALLPAEYIPSPNERLRYYRQLINSQDVQALDEIFLEWEDRFGTPPIAAQLLKESHRLRLIGERLMVESIHVGKDNKATIVFANNPPCADQLLKKITVGECQPLSTSSIKIPLSSEETQQQAQQILIFLQALSASTSMTTSSHVSQ